MLKNGFATLMALLMCGGMATVSPAELVHESTFDGAMFANPVTEGDVSRIWAIGPNLYPAGGVSCCGHWNYTGEGRLLISHGTNNWDDPYYELDMDSVVDAGDTIELEFVLEPEHNGDGLAQYTEILVTGPNLGNGGGEARAATDVIFRLRGDFNYRMRAGFHSGTDGFAYVDITEKFDTVDQVTVTITYNDATDEWKAFLKLDDGRVRQIGSTIVKQRTKNTIRVTNEMAFADGSGVGGRERPWNLYTQAMRIYDEIETTGPDPFEPVVGELLRNSRFDRDPTRWSTNFFYPLDMRDVNGMFVPGPGTQAYDGIGNWVISHPGTALFPNASVTKISTQSMSAEWVLHAKPEFTATGNGQMLNFKVDGNPASFFVGNYSGGGLGTWSIMFGEGESPNPAGGALQSLPVDELEDLVLIVNYDATTEEYRGFYSINGGDVIAHPANPVSQTRTAAGSVEFQWQNWAGDTDPFSIAMVDYAEYAGVVTQVTDPVDPGESLVHEALFDGGAFDNPVTTGDVSRIWAIGGLLHPAGVPCCGYWHYTGEGQLLLSHGPNNWDDPWYEYDMIDAGIEPGDSIEVDFVFEPQFHAEARAQFIEVLVTDPTLASPGNSETPRVNADVILRWWVDFDYRIRQAFVGANNFDGAYANIPQKADEMETVRIVVTYNEGTETWRAFYAIDGGPLREYQGSPINKARTKNTVRVVNEMAFAGGSGGGFPGPNQNERPWNLYTNSMLVYNDIVTTEPDPIVLEPGDILRHSRFDRNPAIYTDFFYPVFVYDLSGMFVPEPATHAYDGAGNWVMNHTGANPLNPNNNIAKFSNINDPTEWRVHVKPQFTATGIGQQFNWKVDGNIAAMFVGNRSGDPGGTWGIIFGENDNVFAPNPANVALQTLPAEELEDLQLVINYNPATEQYNGYYSINGGEMQAHPANPVNYARTAQANVESQLQVWRTAPNTTDPFSIAFHSYEELYGILTTVDVPVVEKDLMWLY